MRKFLLLIAAAAMACSVAQAQITVTVSEGSAAWFGFMNVSELPVNGGAFAFGSGWGVSDLSATFDDLNNTLTLTPNSIGDPDPFWYQGGGAPGNPGNKSMAASLYQESIGGLTNQTVTFEVTVLANSWTSAHETKIFIKDFAPDFSSNVASEVTLAGPGTYSVSLTTINDPARPVQYGFETVGENVWVTDLAPFGSLVVGTVPEPSTFALLGGLFALCFVMYRRRKQA
jgi:hypothetical protein